MATSTVQPAKRNSPTPAQRPARRRRGLFGWLVPIVVVIGCLGFVSLFLLSLADFDMAGNGSPDLRSRAQWVWERGDHLHFAVHMTTGRIYDLCPCTRRAAANQYFEAHFHAVTPRQAALAAMTSPHSAADWSEYLFGPIGVGLDWVHDGIAWLGGQRPTQRVTVLVDSLQFAPEEIHIARGTTVTWRNVDELGDAHSVTADPGQLDFFKSDWIAPDETFSYTFKERGRFVYYDEANGQPGQEGMSGVVVVS